MTIHDRLRPQKMTTPWAVSRGRPDLFERASVHQECDQSACVVHRYWLCCIGRVKPRVAELHQLNGHVVVLSVSCRAFSSVVAVERSKSPQRFVCFPRIPHSCCMLYDRLPT